MCILITKPKGVKFPSMDAIMNSVNNNPDGFSLAYNQRGKLITYKTMSKARFLNKFNRLSSSLDPETTAMIIHARIATHGAVGVANCHCWVSFPNDANEMAFAHNGILSVANRDGMTDSETFLRDYFEPAFALSGWDGGEEVIKWKIGSSKFAFIDRSGEIRKFGHFISEQDGCYYSNMSYARSSYARCADPRYWRC